VVATKSAFFREKRVSTLTSIHRWGGDPQAECRAGSLIPAKKKKPTKEKTSQYTQRLHGGGEGDKEHEAEPVQQRPEQEQRQQGKSYVKGNPATVNAEREGRGPRRSPDMLFCGQKQRTNVKLHAIQKWETRKRGATEARKLKQKKGKKGSRTPIPKERKKEKFDRLSNAGTKKKKICAHGGIQVHSNPLTKGAAKKTARAWRSQACTQLESNRTTRRGITAQTSHAKISTNPEGPKGGGEPRKKKTKCHYSGERMG